VNVGKAYSGLTDGEIDEMQRRFEKMTLERFGSVRTVRPEVVLEVAFDGIQRSTRHKSGFALRFPRIVRVRNDKKASEADRLEAVEALYHAQIASGHREDRPARGTQAGPRRARAATKASPAQLSLFSAPDDGKDDPKARRR
jgi:DNA ligase-1